jgi:AcrR family transcriptional regulator
MPRRYSMDKRAGESDQTRRHILDAVVDVAAESGLDALTVQAVATRADVAVRTIYNYFPTRDNLIAAALGSLAEQTRSSVVAIDVGDRSPRDELLAFVDAYLRSYEDQGAAARVLMNASTIPVVADAVTDVRAWRRQQLTSMLRRAQADGSLRASFAHATEICYLATAYSTFSTLVLERGLKPVSARAIVQTMVDRALFEAG